MKLVPVSREGHATKRIRPLTSFAFAAGMPVISLYGAEVARAAHDFPVGFAAEKEGFFPVAVTGVEPGRSLFVADDGRWLGSYVPALLRRAPFRLAKVGASDEWVLCLDEDSALLSDSEGQPLFAANGTPTEVIAQATRFLAELERNRVATLAACAGLDRMGLLTPWDLRVAKPGEEERQLSGLFRIDEAKLTTVAAAGLAELRDLGALSIAFLQLFSLHKLPAIGRLAAARQQAEARRQTLQQGRFDLDRAFGIVDDDPFQF